jgi:hypothetical protein
MMTKQGGSSSPELQRRSTKSRKDQSTNDMRKSRKGPTFNLAKTLQESFKIVVVFVCIFLIPKVEAEPLRMGYKDDPNHNVVGDCDTEL